MTVCFKKRTQIEELNKRLKCEVSPSKPCIDKVKTIITKNSNNNSKR